MTFHEYFVEKIAFFTNTIRLNEDVYVAVLFSPDGSELGFPRLRDFIGV